ncbi:nitroreductase [Clostridia bacterium]|nr:nitroreductase [Clostridia bacterium]
MNETLNVIAKRYSCRDFTDILPSKENLQAIANAAIASPSANNSQRWKVIVVTNKTLIGELEAEGMKAISELPDKGIYNSLQSRGGTLFYHATCIIFIAIVPGSDLDCGIVSENIAIAAESLGLGSCICGLARFALSESKSAYFKEKLGFPEGCEFGMSVLIGNAKTPRAPHIPDTSKIGFVE